MALDGGHGTRRRMPSTTGYTEGDVIGCRVDEFMSLVAAGGVVAAAEPGCMVGGVHREEVRMRASLPSSAGSRKTVSDKFISRVRRCVWSSLSAGPSSDTASWFPCSGVPVNTSTITLAGDIRSPYCSFGCGGRSPRRVR